jgi:N-acyl-D-aspartate/D-glutamate deacylase
MFDLVIRNAWILGGSGAPGLTSSLAVKDGVIAAIDSDLSTGKCGFDANGLLPEAPRAGKLLREFGTV